jgi:recombination protein RecA
MERDKMLDVALSQIERQFGKGAVMRLGEHPAGQGTSVIPTGSLAMDVALGIGGIPRGRIVEVFGPEGSGKTTVCLHIIAEAQRAGGIAVFIDAEHALDPTYSRALGVNIDELLVSQPDNGEQALEISDMMVRSGAVDLVVIDSVAALVPRAEIEGEMGDSHVGLQARLMSQAMRKLAGSLSRFDTTALFINQLREKIGVMFGCLSYGTRITLADGSQEKIGKIVNQRRAIEVLSYDPEAGAVAPRKVVGWFDNGRTESFLQFTVARASGNGRSQFGCTPNHQIRTPGGWQEARRLRVGDRVMTAVPHRLSDFQWQVILGGLMGDGALSPTWSGLGARFRFGHGPRQVEYCDWKGSLFGNVGFSRSTNEQEAVFYDVSPLPELGELRQAVYIGGKKVFSEDYIKQLTPLSLAIWYMDDGSFSIRAKGLQARTRDGSGRSEICVQAMESSTQARLAAYLSDTWGITPTIAKKRDAVFFVFPKDETAKLHALIAPFVHPSMEYKLLPRYRGRFAAEPVLVPMRYELMPMPILHIGPKPKSRSTHRFDIEVEGSHNYLADGVVVHNSPETTPGGRALKFYASVRLDVRKIDNLKEGSEVIGSRVRVKVVKNKLAPPFRQAEFDIIYGKGISKEGSLIDVGVATEIVKKSGAWLTYEGDQLGQGRENARQFLAEHRDIALEIERKVREAIGLTAFADEDVVQVAEAAGKAAPSKPSPSKAPARKEAAAEPAGVPAGYGEGTGRPPEGPCTHGRDGEGPGTGASGGQVAEPGRAPPAPGPGRVRCRGDRRGAGRSRAGRVDRGRPLRQGTGARPGRTEAVGGPGHHGGPPPTRGIGGGGRGCPGRRGGRGRPGPFPGRATGRPAGGAVPGGGLSPPLRGPGAARLPTRSGQGGVPGRPSRHGGSRRA